MSAFVCKRNVLQAGREDEREKLRAAMARLASVQGILGESQEQLLADQQRLTSLMQLVSGKGKSGEELHKQ